MSDNPSPANTGCRARAHTSLESLEVRRHFAVSLAADGWSRITPADDTRVIYVSSTAGEATVADRCGPAHLYALVA